MKFLTIFTAITICSGWCFAQADSNELDRQLHNAVVSAQSPEKTIELLKNGANPNKEVVRIDPSCPGHDLPAIVYATENLPILKAIVENSKPDLNAIGHGQFCNGVDRIRTPLSFLLETSKYGRDTRLQYLIDHGSDINMNWQSGGAANAFIVEFLRSDIGFFGALDKVFVPYLNENSVILAFQNLSMDLLEQHNQKKLEWVLDLAKGKKIAPNTPHTIRPGYSTVPTFFEKLLGTCDDRSLNYIQRALSLGADPLFDGSEPLNYIVNSCHEGLALKKLDLLKGYRLGFTPKNLLVAMDRGYWILVDSLQAKEPIEPKDVRSILYPKKYNDDYLLEKLSPEALNYLIRLGADLTSDFSTYGSEASIGDHNLWTWFFHKKYWSLSEVELANLNILVKSGIDINHQLRDGKTALMMVVERGHEKQLRWLNQLGVNHDLVDWENETALFKLFEFLGDDHHSTPSGDLVLSMIYNGRNSINTLARGHWISGRSFSFSALQAFSEKAQYFNASTRKEVALQLIHCGAGVRIADEAGRTAIDFIQNNNRLPADEKQDLVLILSKTIPQPILCQAQI